MANPKCSLNYYAVDTDRYHDRRIKRLKKVHGGVGVAIYDYLLCEIYRDKGCYIIYDEDTIFDVSEYWNIEEDRVKEIVEYCASIGLFNEEKLREKGVLTSASIQRRFIEMSTRAKRRDAEIPEEFKILTEESHILPEKTQILPEKTHILPEESPQNKIKKSKIKENISLSISPSSGDSDSRGSLPLTEEERERIIFSFFLRNIKDYKQEAERFFAHYSATGWTRNGESIVDKVALSNTWEPKSKDKLLPPPLMGLWQAIGNALKWESAELIYGLHNIDIDRGVVNFYGTKELMDILYQNEGILPSILNNQSVNANSWRFRVPKIA